MKTVRTVKSSRDGSVSNPSSGHTTPRGKHENNDVVDDDDDDDDDGDDGDCDEPVTTTTPVTDSCLASHEFEWLSPSHIPLYSSSGHDKGIDHANESAEERIEPPIPAPRFQIQHQTKKSSNASRQKRVKERECSGCSLSPSPCHDTHGYHHRLSPMRSSWCCPSPPPPHIPSIPMCLHHGGVSVTGMELVPYGQDCCTEDHPYMSCYCMTQPSPQPIRHYDPYNCHHYNQPHFAVPLRTTPSPSSPHEIYRNAGRRSRSAGTKKRDYSPSPQHYASVVTGESSHSMLPPLSTRHSWRDQWKPPIHSEDISSLQKLQQLESDKKNLLLQVSVLTDQVDAQTDKINELENVLEQKKEQLRHIEQNLHQEMMASSAIEHSKLELRTEVSNLRLRLTAAERDRKDSDDRCRKLEGDLALLHACVADKSAEHSSLTSKVGRNGTVLPASDKNSEIEKLRGALESVMVSNEEKDRKIEDLRQALMKYKKLQDYVFSGHSRKASDTSTKDSVFLDGDKETVSPPSPGSESLKQSQTESNYVCKPPQVPRTQVPSTSTPIQSDNGSLSWRESAVTRCSPTSTGSTCPLYKGVQSFQKSNSVENVCPSSPKTPSPTSRYGTIPRQSGPQALQLLHEQLQQHEGNSRFPVGNGDTIDAHLGPATSTNSPEMGKQGESQRVATEPIRTTRNKSTGVSFAQQESVTIPLVERENSCPSPSPTPQPLLIKPEKDKKGFMKFFTKWKRSGSQNIEKVEGDFKRGGIRATAGPRLGWSRDVPKVPDIPFPRWTTDTLVEWLQKIGLNMYISDCKKWKCNGEQLLKASSHELEKELSIKNPMHKKKLMLALQSMSADQPCLPPAINSLDYQWVVRWLDDVGLPQYKDSFTDARVDGRVLHYLTIEDLFTLKVTNQLHHVSIKRGIQVLREKNFDPHCLIRRSLPDEDKNYTPELVSLWTNHRVMEWLRTVDLSEYAPNLRGSGVHGALIVYEPKFNTDLFATVLNIPPTKTLLRRHLATHFKHVVGADLIQVKRDLETDQLYTPLTPNIKIKVMRKGQFALKKKRTKPDVENEEFVCPMVIPVGSEVVKQDGEKLVVRRNSDPAPQESRLLDFQEEKTAEEIGAVSKEITSLTNMLQEEKLLRSVPTTNV